MRNMLRGLLPTAVLAVLPFAAHAGIELGVSVGFAPPALPVYEQPEIPAPGYLWTPGYWAWSPIGYYWVPGTWVLPPMAGLLWTPGYWGFAGGGYFWHAGYWGPHVGFYGGIDYGYGYRGAGYEGGYWRGNQFMYNRACSNVRNISVTNVYVRNVVNVTSVNRVSFNGGAGGIVARPSSAQFAAAHEQHVAFTSAQRQQQSLARSDTALRAAVNGGHPAVAATPRPGQFSGHGVVAAREAPLPVSYPSERAVQSFGASAVGQGGRVAPAPGLPRPQGYDGRTTAAGNRVGAPPVARTGSATAPFSAQPQALRAPVYRSERPPQAAAARSPTYQAPRPPQLVASRAAPESRAAPTPQGAARYPVQPRGDAPGRR